jgi:hypothetical protein
MVVTAKTSTEAFMREIVAQGPQKSLARGFAGVRRPRHSSKA